MASIHCAAAAINGWYTLVAVKCFQYICHTFPLFDFSVMLAVAGPYVLCALHIIVFVQISITDCICVSDHVAMSDYICYYSVCLTTSVTRLLC